MRIALAIAVPLIAALLQSSVGPFIEIAGARPNFLILFAGSWAVAAGAAEAMWWAFIGGLAADLLSAGPLGAFAASSIPAVGAVGLGERTPGRSTPVLVAAALVGVAALAAGLLYIALLALVGQPLPALPALAADTIAEGIYTALLGVLIYPIARAVRTLIEKESPF